MSVDRLVKYLVGNHVLDVKGIRAIKEVGTFGYNFEEGFKNHGILVRELKDSRFGSVKVLLARHLIWNKSFLIFFIDLEPYFEREESKYHIVSMMSIMVVISDDGEQEYYLLLENSINNKYYYYVKKIDKPVVRRKFYEKFYEREHYCLDDHCELYFNVYDREKDKILPLLKMIFEGVDSG